MKISFPGVPYGVALALETIAEPTEERIDDERPIPSYPEELSKVETIFIDILTLAREVIWEIPMESLNVLYAKEKLDEAIEAIDDIPSLTGTITFFNTFSRLLKDPLYIKQHKDGTKLKIRTDILFKVAMQYTYNVYPNNNSLVFCNNAFYLSTLITLKPEILVLRGHTGTILDRITLNKLYGVKNKDKIPFNFRLVKLLGDGKYISGIDNKTKVTIVDKATKDWTPHTSNDTIMRYILLELKIKDR